MMKTSYFGRNVVACLRSILNYIDWSEVFEMYTDGVHWIRQDYEQDPERELKALPMVLYKYESKAEKRADQLASYLYRRTNKRGQRIDPYVVRNALCAIFDYIGLLEFYREEIEENKEEIEPYRVWIEKRERRVMEVCYEWLRSNPEYYGFTYPISLRSL